MKKLALGILIALIPALLGGCTYVGQGHVGLLIDNTNGQIKEVLEPGYRGRMLVTQHIVEYPILRQQYVMVSAAGEGQHADDDAVSVNSSEGQVFKVDASVDFQLNHDAESIKRLYTEYVSSFDNVVETRYRSIFRSAITTAFASHPIMEAVTGDGRSKIAELARSTIEKDLKTDGIKVYAVLIRGVHLPKAIEDSIANKTKAENELVQSRTSAQQKVVEAQADAQAKLVRAQADAKSNELIAKSIDGRLLQLRSIEKLNPNVQVISVPPNAFLNLGGVVQPLNNK